MRTFGFEEMGNVTRTADPDGTGLTVLIAEDSASVALLLRTLLTRWGFSVHVTRCDDSAVRALAESRFDIAVIGGTAGDAATVEAACGDVPILALVTQSSQRSRAAVELVLPPNAAALRDAVHQCLNGGEGELNAQAVEILWGSTTSPIFHRIVRVFIGEVADRVARIATALTNDDLPAIEIEAHSIKGASANVCAHRIRDAAARLEATAARGDVVALPADVDALRDAVASGVSALKRILP